MLLSDGTNTAGRSPADAAAAATEAGVPVVHDRVRHRRRAPSTIDGQTQRCRSTPTRCAGSPRTPAGRRTRPRPARSCGEVYADIGSSIGTRTERQEVSAWFIGAGLVVAAAAAAASLAWFSRLP